MERRTRGPATGRPATLQTLFQYELENNYILVHLIWINLLNRPRAILILLILFTTRTARINIKLKSLNALNS